MELKIRILIIAAIVMLLFTGCSKKTYDTTPLMGLSWYSEPEQVKENISTLKLVEERQADGKTMLDYDGAMIFDMEMSVTLCFTDSGLVGLNYHDIKRNKTYYQWLEFIEDHYGIANENAIGSASWFENPVGKNTAVYLFDMVEGVQISFYGTYDTPDKSYSRKKPSEEKVFD